MTELFIIKLSNNIFKAFFTFQLSAEFAVKARKKYPEKDILILGSLGPICESHQPGRFTKYLSEKGNLLLKIVSDNNKPFIVSSYRRSVLHRYLLQVDKSFVRWWSRCFSFGNNEQLERN